MELVICATCRTPLSQEQLDKARRQGRIPKYCSSECWGKRPREHNYDHEFLNEDNDLSAYYTGWYVTDGHFAKDDRTIKITCVDKQLVDDFLKRINFTNSINIRNTHIENHNLQYSFSLAGDVTKRIEEMGYSPGPKGGKEFFPKRFYNNQWFFSCLRGIVDGDGCLQKIEQGSLVMYIVSMSELFLNEILKWVYDKQIVRGGTVFKTRLNLYKLQFSHFDTIQICQRMYENATIKLDRKYQIYLAGKDYVQGCESQTNLKCSVESCFAPARSCGLCKKHYDQQCHKQYYEDHKEELLEKNNAWRETNRDHVNEKRRELYSENPERFRETSKEWRETHPEQVAEAKKEYNATHREQINESKREYRQENLEQIRAQEHESYLRNKDNKLESSRRYKQEHKTEIDAKNAEYRNKTKEERKAYDKARYLEKKNEILQKRKEDYAINKEEILSKKKEWREVNKEENLAKRRAKYAAKKS